MRKLKIRIPQDRDVLYKVIKYPAGEIQTRLTEAGLAAAPVWAAGRLRRHRESAHARGGRRQPHL